MNWFRQRCTPLEVVTLLLCTFLFFRPDWVVDRLHPKYVSAPASELYTEADRLQADDWLVVGIAGEDLNGAPIVKTVALPLGEGANGRERLRSGGVTLSQLGDTLEVANVKFGSRARKLGVEQGYKVVELKLPNPQRPSSHWVFLPAALLAGWVWWRQGRRQSRTAA